MNHDFPLHNKIYVKIPADFSNLYLTITTQGQAQALIALTSQNLGQDLALEYLLNKCLLN